ncbi:hypothetical protein OG943_38015 [Amycolatopsis sp. NBC_00345]|uniref:hypothetical protein n=1 Tax=Amycolatopsis sp. NBC_00345 TaxID=2975955 RepID=UPI002E26409E
MDLAEIFGTECAEPQTIDWAEVEAAYGAPLPADYRAYADAYPALELDSQFVIRHPLSKNTTSKLVECGKDVLEAFAGGRREFPEAVPYPLFPEPGGLLPWGSDYDGADYFWRTAGRPGEWTIAVFESAEWWEFPGGFGAFWTELAAGRIDSPVIAEGYLRPGYSVRCVGD